MKKKSRPKKPTTQIRTHNGRYYIVVGPFAESKKYQLEEAAVRLIRDLNIPYQGKTYSSSHYGALTTFERGQHIAARRAEKVEILRKHMRLVVARLYNEQYFAKPVYYRCTNTKTETSLFLRNDGLDNPEVDPVAVFKGVDFHHFYEHASDQTPLPSHCQYFSPLMVVVREEYYLYPYRGSGYHRQLKIFPNRLKLYKNSLIKVPQSLLK